MVEIEKPRISCFDSTENISYGKYVVEPLERGYGMTLGNSPAQDPAVQPARLCSHLGEDPGRAA